MYVAVYKTERNHVESRIVLHAERTHCLQKYPPVALIIRPALAVKQLCGGNSQANSAKNP